MEAPLITKPKFQILLPGIYEKSFRGTSKKCKENYLLRIFACNQTRSLTSRALSFFNAPFLSGGIAGFFLQLIENYEFIAVATFT